MLESKTDFRVRYSETDAMGIAHQTSFVVWFEVSRIQLLREKGFSYRKLEASGYFLPLIELNLGFKKTLKFDDPITVKAMIKERPRNKLFVDFELTRDGQLAATGRSTHVFVDKDHRLTRMPEAFKTFIDQHFPEEAITS